MDFKVAGTQRGVTGIQLDLKNHGITEVIIRETLDQAREARLEILRAMLRSIKRPREEISANAPRLIQIQINPEKIGMVIGPGGKTIRRLQEETGAKIDIDDTGVVTLSSLEAAGAEAARDKIVAMTEGVQVGRIYEGRVTSIKEFGAFVEILPGKDGLVHISELSDGYVSSVTEVCRVGDPMLVKAIAVDDQDRVKLSRKAALAERGQVDELAGRTRPPASPRRAAAIAAAPAAVLRRGRPRRTRGGGDRDRGGYGGDRGGPRRLLIDQRPERRLARSAGNCPMRLVWLTGDSSGLAWSRSILRPPAAAEISHGQLHAQLDLRFAGHSRQRNRSRVVESLTVADAVASQHAGDDQRPDAGARELVDDEPDITRRLRAQYTEISQLAGGLAHEIRNPLSTVSLNLDLLAEDFQKPETPRDRRVFSGSSGCSTRFTGSTISSRTFSGSPGFRS